MCMIMFCLGSNCAPSETKGIPKWHKYAERVTVCVKVD